MNYFILGFNFCLEKLLREYELHYFGTKTYLYKINFYFDPKN